MKKVSKTKTFGILTLLFLVIAVVWLSDFPTYWKVKQGNIVDYNAVEAFTLKKGDVVEGTVDMVLGATAEEYSTQFGIRTSDDSTKLFYVLWMDNDNFILYETANKSVYDTMDTITDETFAYLDSLSIAEESGDYEDLVVPTTTYHLEGVVEKVPAEIQQYFREWYEEGIGDDFDARCEPVLIRHMDLERISTLMICGIVFAVLGIVCGILTLVFWRKSKQDATSEW